MRKLCSVAIFAIACGCVSEESPAQTRELIEMGRNLAGPPVHTDADLIQTPKTGQQASRDYARCLEDNAVELASTGVDAYSAVRAAKGACSSSRSEFYSAVYQDRRKSTSHRNSVAFANQMLGYFDDETDEKLPSVVMRTTARRKAEQPMPDKYSQLEKIKGLLDSGAISQEEFTAEKAKILSR